MALQWLTLADDSGLHPVVKDLARGAADRLERGDMAAQDGLEVLVDDEARPDQPGVTEHQGEEPDDPRGAGFVEEAHLEASEIDLRLRAGRCLETHLEGPRGLRLDLPHGVLHHGVAAGEAAFLQFAIQALGRQTRIGGKPIAQKGQKRIDALGAGVRGP